MSALVVPFRVITSRNDARRGHAPIPAPVGDWEAELTGTLWNEDCRATVTWAFHVDGCARSYAVEVHTDGWDYPITLSGRHRPEDCKVVRAKHDAILWLINQLMVASYGVPA